MEQTKWEYLLTDDSGANSEYNVPVLIPVGGTFQHQYGYYRVENHYTHPGGEVVVICERIK